MSNELKLSEQFNSIEPRFVELATPETFRKECSFALQHFNKNKYLSSSTTNSKLQAVLNIAQTGLTLNPVLKLAYLVPRYNAQKRAVECFLEPSYQGLVKLITDTGSAKNVVAHVVYEGDEFEVLMGTTENVVHKPKFQTKNITHVYAIATLSDGSKQIEVMTSDQVDEIRNSSESYKSFKSGKSKSCIWDDHYSEMARKTVVKRLVKYLPKTNMWDKLGQAIEIDNQDYGASDDQKDYIDSLLMNANIDPDEVDSITRELEYMSSERASELIQFLKDNQVNPILAGRPYGQTEVSKMVENKLENNEE